MERPLPPRGAPLHTPKNAVDQRINVSRGQRLPVVCHEKPMVERTEEHVQKQIRIQSINQLATGDPLAHDRTGDLPYRLYPSRLHRLHQLLVQEGPRDYSREQRSTAFIEDPHVIFQCGGETLASSPLLPVSVYSENVGEKRVQNNCPDVGPPPIEGRFGNAGLLGNLLDRQVFAAVTLRQREGRAEDFRRDQGAAGPASGTSWACTVGRSESFRVVHG